MDFSYGCIHASGLLPTEQPTNDAPNAETTSCTFLRMWTNAFCHLQNDHRNNFPGLNDTMVASGNNVSDPGRSFTVCGVGVGILQIRATPAGPHAAGCGSPGCQVVRPYDMVVTVGEADRSILMYSSPSHSNVLCYVRHSVRPY
jgi:hypothetical protein